MVYPVLVLPVHLFFFAVAVFFLVRMIPGDPVAVLTGGQNVSAQKEEQIRASLGLTGSMFSQFIRYLHNVVTLHFGNSMVDGLSVWGQLTQRLPDTIELAVIAMVIATALTVVMGLVAVLKPGSILAKILVPYARTAGAIPDFVLGVLGILLLLHVSPAAGAERPLRPDPEPGPKGDRLPTAGRALRRGYRDVRLDLRSPGPSGGCPSHREHATTAQDLPPSPGGSRDPHRHGSGLRQGRHARPCSSVSCGEQPRRRWR